MLKKLKSTDIFLIILTFICCIGGIILVFSLVYNNEYQKISSGISSSLWKTKLIAFGIGLILCIIIAKLGIKRISKLWILAAVIGLTGVILTFTSLGVGPQGTDDIAWLKFKGITIQPSEILKLCFIISFSVHITKVKSSINKPLVLLGLLVHAAVPITLVCLQGDQGTAVVFIIIALIMLFAGGIKWQYILSVLLLSPVILWTIWNFFLLEHQKNRILVLFNPNLDPLGTGYQQIQGKKAIANGGIFGKGLFSGKTEKFIPVAESQNDFIFSYVGQTLGIIGCIIVSILLFLICLRILIDSTKCDTLGSEVCAGVMAMIFSHSIINIGMVLGFMPVIGIPLPFFSAGGTAMITMLASIGLVLSCLNSNGKGKSKR